MHVDETNKHTDENRNEHADEKKQHTLADENKNNLQMKRQLH